MQNSGPSQAGVNSEKSAVTSDVVAPGATPKNPVSPPQTNDIPPDAQAALVSSLVFLAFMGQMLLNPIIAPLARQIGLKEWHIGATISLAAITLASLSPYWGRASQRLGVKRILATGMLITTIALSAFGVIAYLGMNKMCVGTGLVFGVLATRGLLYGVGISAVAPSSQTHLMTHIPSETGRVKAMGMIGAAQGIASIIGGIVGGLLAAIGGLLLPLAAMPVFMLIGIAVLLTRFHPSANTHKIERPKRISYTDPRVFPWLIAGLLLFFVFSTVTTIFGFTVQDRFHLSAQSTAGITAIYLTVMGVTMILTQAIIVPKTRWSAAKLLRVGTLIFLAAIACLWPVNSHILMSISCISMGVGLGMAIPGYSTGPTLLLDESEQGGIAGLINSNNGLAYAIAPIASTALYGARTTAPFIAALALVVIIAVFCHSHPALRK
ncbi:MAG: MFS transporter [Actinomycetaceae bacterium]|nr:MFS transporter [Actinomycetaceae bacterium]